MKLEKHQRIDYETAKCNALRAMNYDVPMFANTIADEIWPGHEMVSQGAGAAASRILKRMEKEKLAKWVSHGGSWGWVKREAI